MDEVDRVLFQSLTRLGWEAEGERLGSLNGEETMEAIIRCLWAIQPSIKTQIPSKNLPPHITARFKLASAVVDAIKDLGFRNDIGYQTILYGAEGDIRKILLFLVERLPVEGGTSGDAIEAESSLEPLIAEGRSKLKKRLEEAWLPYWYPHFCQRQELVWKGRLWHPPEKKSASDQPDVQRLREAIQAKSQTNAKLRVKPNLPPKPQIAPKPRIADSADDLPSEAESPQKQSSQLQTIQSEQAAVAVEMETLLSSLSTAAAESERMRRSAMSDEEKSWKEAELKELRRWTAALDSPADTILALRAYLSESEKRVAELERRWEEGSRGTREELEKLGRRDGPETMALRAEMDELRSRCEEMLGEAEIKSRLEYQLERELAKVTQGSLNREAYTERILEMVKSVGKQRSEIEKVVDERLTVEAEVNRVGGRLERSMAAAEKLLFVDANKDSQLGRAYRLLHSLHDGAAAAQQLLEETGAIERETTQLRDALMRRDAKGTDSSLERIVTDLDALNADNLRLQALLQNYSHH